jgi:hypothetical protein
MSNVRTRERETEVNGIKSRIESEAMGEQFSFLSYLTSKQFNVMSYATNSLELAQRSTSKAQRQNCDNGETMHVSDPKRSKATALSAEQYGTFWFVK